jgi:hypothetical protein
MIINEAHPNLSIYRLGASLISILTNSPLEWMFYIYMNHLKKNFQ